MEMYFHQPNHIYYETRAVFNVNICKNLILHVMTFLPKIRISASEPKPWSRITRKKNFTISVKNVIDRPKVTNPFINVGVHNPTNILHVILLITRSLYVYVYTYMCYNVCKGMSISFCRGSLASFMSAASRTCMGKKIIKLNWKAKTL